MGEYARRGDVRVAIQYPYVTKDFHNEQFHTGVY